MMLTWLIPGCLYCVELLQYLSASDQLIVFFALLVQRKIWEKVAGTYRSCGELTWFFCHLLDFSCIALMKSWQYMGYY